MEKENKTTKCAASKKLTLLKAVETIVEKSCDSQLCDLFLKQCKKEIKLVADSYNITPQQAILFCITVECGPRNVRLIELSHHLNMRNVASLSFDADIKAMVKMRLMRYRDRERDAFDIPEHVISALQENRAQIFPNLKVEDAPAIFDVMGTWFIAADHNDISPEDLSQDLLALFKDNQHIGFARQMLDLKLDNASMMLLAYFCNQLINEDDERLCAHELKCLYDRCYQHRSTVMQLASGKHILAKKELIEPVCEDGRADMSTFTLTNKAKSKLLAEFELSKPEVKLSNVLYPDSITPKVMFYPKAMMQQVKELNSFLEVDKFKQIQQRMTDNGFRTGFACLFYGAPGTGKTETVYQLAKKTGRCVMAVDVPQIKSKWVGDSEKNIKALFDKYRKQVNRSDVAPILLFNEADAIFGVRKNGAESAVDKMENTIQNIILQEMEDLNGILIATTNLTTNLDSAFERRFLYKIEFEQPDAKVRSRIWQSMVSGLSDDDANVLAQAYELSGGQIENIARKDTINRVLYGDSSNTDRLSTLMDYCKAETMQSAAKTQRIGFN